MSAPGIVLQHDPEAPPALLADWLGERRIPWRLVELWHEPVPDIDGAAFAVALGSEHSAGARAPSFIPHEIALLRRAVECRIPVLGLCFGAQALAIALGGRVHPADPVEIGWDEIESLVPDRVPAGRWLNFHYESFTMPPGAELLARSPAGPAAFALGAHLGVQFHPEATPEIADGWVRSESRRVPGIDLGHVSVEGHLHGPDAARRATILFERWWQCAGRTVAESVHAA